MKFSAKLEAIYEQEHGIVGSFLLHGDVGAATSAMSLSSQRPCVRVPLSAENVETLRVGRTYEFTLNEAQEGA